MFLNEKPMPSLPVVEESEQCETFKSNLRLATSSTLRGSSQIFQNLAYQNDIACSRCYAEAKRTLGDRYMSVGSVVDVAAGQHSMCSSSTMPTITASRGKGHDYFLPWRRQRISTVELGRLQGGVIARHPLPKYPFCVARIA